MFLDCDAPLYYDTPQITGAAATGIFTPDPHVGLPTGTPVVQATGGRTANGRVWRSDQFEAGFWGMMRSYAAHATFGQGIAMKVVHAYTYPMVLATFCNNAHILVFFQWEANGSITCWRYSSSLDHTLLGGTTPGLMQTGVWNGLGFMVKVDATTGTADVWLNGASVLHLTGLNTKGYDGTYTTIDTVTVRIPPTGDDSIHNHLSR